MPREGLPRVRPQKGMSNTPLETSKHLYHLSMWLFIYVSYKLYIYIYIYIYIYLYCVFQKQIILWNLKTAPSEVGERRKSETNIVLGGRKKQLKLTDRR